MAKDKDKIELNSDSDKAGEKPAKDSKPKSSKKKSVDFKKIAPVFLVVLIVTVVVAGAVYMNSSTNDGDEVIQEQALTDAEKLEQRKLVDNADQDDHNSVNLGLVDAYYREENYERALELLELIENPSEQIILAYNKLYGAVLIGLGRDDEALSYNQAALKASESSLLAAAEQDPVAYYNLGKLYADTGQTDKAIESYQKLLDAYNDGSAEGYESYDEEIVELTKQAIEELR